MKRIMALLISILLISVMLASPKAEATSLKIAPLRYQTTLTQGEKQKGYVDVSNPSTQTIHLKFEVQAFRQIDNQGGVEFYQDNTVSSGVLLDLDSTDLGPFDVLRLYFMIDSAKLPPGEVYAAILARTVPDDTSGAVQAVRVGTILEITNGHASSHSAVVDSFSAPFFQFGEQITARFVVRNNEVSTQPSGFRPQINFGVKPYGAQSAQGPLVFSGLSRTVDYKLPGNYFGFVWLQAGVGSSSKGSLSFVMIGYWRWLGPMIIFACISLFVALRHTLHKKH